MNGQRDDITGRAWVEVDLGALVRNGRRVARHAGVPLLPMVKADGYGLGAVAVAHALLALEPWGFGVATVDEGRALRAAGIRSPLVVFTPLRLEQVPAAHALGLTPVLGDAPAVVSAWGERGGRWHLGIDTGMSRSGVPWHEVGGLADLVRRFAPEGACTHFHSAECHDGSRQLQERRFREALAALPARPPLLHVENSAGVSHGGPSAWSLVRPGVFLYGVGSGTGAAIHPEPVVSLRARIVSIRDLRRGEGVSYGASWRAEGDRRIATAAVGYADGYRRALGPRGTALVRGRAAAVVGLVTMDMTMLDVTDTACEVDDVATFIGRDGSAALTVEGVAAAAELSPYELLTGLHARPPRLYTEAAA